MANELNADPGITGLTGAYFETWLNGSISNVSISASQIGSSSIYTGNMTGSSGKHLVKFFKSDGTDLRCNGTVDWDGSKEVTAVTIEGEVTGSVNNYFTVTAAQAAALQTAGAIPVVRGDQLTAYITGLGSLVGRTKLVLTVKLASQIQTTTNTDSAAILQVQESVGLTIFNGSSTVTAADASITVTNASTGALTLVVNAAETSQIPLEDCVYDIQWIDGSGQPHTPVSLAPFVITADVTQSIS